MELAFNRFEQADNSYLNFNYLYINYQLMLKSLLLVGAGSFIGGAARYFIIHIVSLTSFTHYPVGTTIVNLIGCFLVGIIFGIIEKGNYMDANLQLFFIFGICGGFTTFSSFVNDCYMMIKNGDYIKISLYASFNLFASLMLLFLGKSLVK
jgi:fluoride exporter